MTDKPTSPREFQRLRRQAEQELAGRGVELPASFEDVLALAQELQVHQAELEIQNQELREANHRAEAAQRHYRELFESAPAGYLLLDGEGRIREANKASAELLHVGRSRLAGLRLEGQLRLRAFGGLSGLLAECLRWGQGVSSEAEVFFHGERARFLHLQITPWQNGQAHGPAFLAALVDITPRRAAEERSARLAKERQMLLQELNHRVGNNLQMLSSLAGLEAREGGRSDPLEALVRFRQRLQALAKAYRILQKRTDLPRVRVCDYLSELLAALGEFADDSSVEISLVCGEEASDWQMEASRVADLGFAVWELVTNACRHAFDASGGRVEVRLARAGSGEWEASVADNGAGFGHEAVCSGEGLGLTIVRSLAQSRLGARMSWDYSGRGSRCVLTLAEVS